MLINLPYIYIQDTVDIGVKLKTTFIIIANIFPIGPYVVTKAHFLILYNSQNEDEHFSLKEDIYPRNKMNFATVLRISHPRIRIILQRKVPGNEATYQYLKIMNMILHAFLDENLSPSKRLYYI